MRIIEFSDASTFLAHTREFLFSAEIEHSLLLSSALTLKRTNAPRIPALVFLAVVDSQSLTRGAALRSPTRRWIVSVADADAAAAMGREIARRDPGARTVFVTSAFETALLSEFESRTHFAGASQNLMSLARPLPLAEPADGMMRLAHPRDLKKLVRWSHEFAKECGLDESPSEAEDVIRKYLANRQLFVWERANEPLAMAAFGGLTPKSTRISMVYTDHAARGRGFAKTLVHRLAHRLLSEGHATCVLFSDSSNLMVNRLYESIGFKTVARFTELRDSKSKSQDSDLREVSSSH